MPTILQVIVWGLRAPTNLPFSTLKDEKSATPLLPPLASSTSWKLVRLRFLAGMLLDGWEMVRNYLPRMKLASPQASLPPTLLLPRVLSGYLSFSTQPVGREVRKRFPSSLRGGQLWLGLGSPAESSRSRRKGSCNPGEDATEGRRRPEGRPPGRGRRIRGGGSVSGSRASSAPPGAGCGP